MPTIASTLRAVFIVALLLTQTACFFRPLYGADSYAPDSSSYALSQISVQETDDWVTQQVRNRLIFLLQGGRQAPEAVYQLRLFVLSNNRHHATSRIVSDTTAGLATVTVNYELIRLADNEKIANGTRTASADFDRTGQSFANQRAIRDAQQRAAREAAEQLRLALAADLSRT